MVVGVACRSTHVLTFQIAAENEYLTLREFSDIVWSKSLCFLLHMYF